MGKTPNIYSLWEKLGNFNFIVKQFAIFLIYFNLSTDMNGEFWKDFRTMFPVSLLPQILVCILQIPHQKEGTSHHSNANVSVSLLSLKRNSFQLFISFNTSKNSKSFLKNPYFVKNIKELFKKVWRRKQWQCWSRQRDS